MRSVVNRYFACEVYFRPFFMRGLMLNLCGNMEHGTRTSVDELPYKLAWRSEEYHPSGIRQRRARLAKDMRTAPLSAGTLVSRIGFADWILRGLLWFREMGGIQPR